VIKEPTIPEEKQPSNDESTEEQNKPKNDANTHHEKKNVSQRLSFQRS